MPPSLTGGFDDLSLTVPLQDNVLCCGRGSPVGSQNDVKGDLMEITF